MSQSKKHSLLESITSTAIGNLQDSVELFKIATEYLIKYDKIRIEA